MLGHDLIVVPTQGRPPAIIEGSGRKARDRIEHFLRAAIDNDNTRRAYGASPLPLVLVGILIFAFLGFGARRYRYFNVWRARDTLAPADDSERIVKTYNSRGTQIEPTRSCNWGWRAQQNGPHMLDNDRRGSENWPDLRGKRILVLEDDPVIAVEWYFQLKRLGATQVFEATNQLALQYLVGHNVDAAIVDYTLRDGCCTPVLELLTARQIPFIIISGDTFGLRQASIDAPVLSKPVMPAEVWSALSGVLTERPHMRHGGLRCQRIVSPDV